MPYSEKTVAIVGSARSEITGDKEEKARQACREIGRELATRGWNLCVYSSDPKFIEADVVSGYIASGKAQEESICIRRPLNKEQVFAEREAHPRVFFDLEDTDESWEVSFYKTLEDVQGLLLLGGGTSTLNSGHIVLARGLPVVAVKDFGGKSADLSLYLKQKDHPGAIFGWSDDSAAECADSLDQQHESRLGERREAESEHAELKRKADSFDALEESKGAFFRGVVLLLLFLGALITGLCLPKTGWPYTTLFVLSLAVAGGLGASVRMLVPGAPKSHGREMFLGIIVGLLFALLYLIPQWIGAPGFLETGQEIVPALRMQFISALLVAVMAGLAFDVAIAQLLQKAKVQQEKIGGVQG